MPAEAPSTPRPAPGDGLAHYRREYLDPLGRPLVGTATFTGRTRTEDAGRITMPTPVTVPLVDGVLEADLPPDTYTVSVALRNVDGHRVTDQHTATLEGN